MPEIAAS